MATTTPNYGWPVPTSTDLVKNGATAIEALGDAIDSTVFGLGASGLVKINTTSFTAVSSQSVDNVFSATYDNYLIHIKLSAISSADTNLNFYLRSSVPADITTGYQTEFLSQAAATIAGISSGDGLIGATSNTNNGQYDGYTMYLYSPFTTQKKSYNTSGHRQISGGTQYQIRAAGYLNSTTSCTGFKLLSSSGTITGKMSIYGFSL